MGVKVLPPQTYLVECFSYNPNTGELRWKWRPMCHFDYVRTTYWRVNRIYAGKPAGKSNGIFVQIGLHYTNWQAHRIIWKWMTGYGPPPIIDHIDGDAFNNRWTNLREATASQNGFNVKPKHWINRGMPKGVYPSKNGQRFVSHANTGKDVGKRHLYLGTFDTPEEAHAAWWEVVAERQGEFAHHLRPTQS